MKLNRTGSIWDRNERININDNWDMIENFILTNGKELFDSEAFSEWLKQNDFKPKDAVNTFSDLPSDAELKEIRGVLDENSVYIFNGKEWVKQSEINFDGLASFKSEVNQNVSSAMILASGASDDLYIPEPLPNLNSYFINNDAFEHNKFSEIYDLFDDIYENNKGYISKTVKGLIWNKFDFPVYVYAPKKFSHTIIIEGGMHGDERVALISLYEFLKRLTEDWKEIPQFAYIRNNVRLVVMPLTNPYGVEYVRRRNENNVDIYRNFDYRWEETVDDTKGTSAASEIETQYIQEVIEEYKDAISYLGLHNFGAVELGKGFSNVSYIPSQQDFRKDVLEKIMISLNPLGDKYDIKASDHANGFNYAAYNYGMNAFAPEFIPGHNFTAFSSEDMTKAFEFFANAIIRFATLKDKVNVLKNYEPRIISRNDTQALGAGKKITDTSFSRAYLGTLIPRGKGYVKVTYHLTYMTTDANTSVHFVPKLYQEMSKNTDYQSTTPMASFESRFGVYSKGAGTQTITCTGIMPINEFDGNVFYELMSRVTTGSAEILRMRSFMEFVPTKHPNPVSYNI